VQFKEAKTNNLYTATRNLTKVKLLESRNLTVGSPNYDVVRLITRCSHPQPNFIIIMIYDSLIVYVPLHENTR